MGEIIVLVNGIDVLQYLIDSINFQLILGFNELLVGFNFVYVRGSEGCVFLELFFIDIIFVFIVWIDIFFIDCFGDLVIIYLAY